MRNRLVFTAIAIAVLVPLSVFADPITGELAFTGNVTATFTSLDFTCASGQSCSSGQGSFTIDGAASTGTFAGLGAQTGHIMGINNSSTPPGSTVSLANFLTLPGGVSFTLTELNLGTGGACPPAPGSTCTPTSSLLASSSNPSGKTGTIFEDTATGSSAEFSVRRRRYLGFGPDNGLYWHVLCHLQRYDHRGCASRPFERWVDLDSVLGDVHPG